ncbi:MAG TPA: hypothetical protein VGF73_12310, partial [Chthoniobacterales bacterium]
MFPIQRLARVCLTQLSLALAICATLIAPSAFAIPGDLYVTDLAANSINVFAFDGSVTTFTTGLNQPQGIIVTPGGGVYVSDSGSGSVFQYTPDGTQTVLATGLSNPM